MIYSKEGNVLYGDFQNRSPRLEVSYPKQKILESIAASLAYFDTTHAWRFLRLRENSKRPEILSQDFDFSHFQEKYRIIENYSVDTCLATLENHRWSDSPVFALALLYKIACSIAESYGTMPQRLIPHISAKVRLFSQEDPRTLIRREITHAFQNAASIPLSLVSEYPTKSADTPSETNNAPKEMTLSERIRSKVRAFLEKLKRRWSQDRWGNLQTPPHEAENIALTPPETLSPLTLHNTVIAFYYFMKTKEAQSLSRSSINIERVMSLAETQKHAWLTTAQKLTELQDTMPMWDGDPEYFFALLFLLSEDILSFIPLLHTKEMNMETPLQHSHQ